MLPSRDAELIQIVDASLAQAVERSQRIDGTSWLTCHAGCTPCCQGVFRISRLDAERLRSGLTELRQADPSRAEAIVTRAKALVGTLFESFPGDARTGILAEDELVFDAFAELPEADAPCPVLHPTTGLCELYASRPLTCRIFGPPVRNQDGMGICELCYVNATEDDVLAGEMHLNHYETEEDLDRELPKTPTVIAWALLP